ncbi:diphosphoinositol polyphosphate phosphohydrolase-like protein [Galdieria sulphuraria]|uniref:Diphosphoinositol polyphosphate phosphohydrolase-like protein n=1 Tax=Galdieria sulphuraria TaxID=130081 RepID=M2WA39_GALSU|nr:diphosphoinositol polyphosphate phosphohydrolase-like protein [Galdieria sulphuraria]EME32766.1 diphosphoinositol polyphosphate phosphohydrolase-like protein [Galdieria sulphuraria]|eukprot:XP_005709286.1 diphosphoinositol polyphosphate phosphohydrolase-like protein [Galdieria sulphuraria]
MGKKVAGCVPVRKGENGEWQVLLVQSRFKPDIWLFPKGGIEKREKNWDAALRETVEEAGVCGRILCKLGKWKGSNEQKLIMYLLLVEQELPKSDSRWKERNERPRTWLSFDQAEKTILQVDTSIRRPELLEMLLLAKARILTLMDNSPESYSSDSSPEEDENDKEVYQQ